jgi:hypothetical protein
MKRQIKILFRILLLLSIFLFLEINVYTHNTIHPNIIELSSKANNAENNLSQECDTYDEDFIIYTSGFNTLVEENTQIFHHSFSILKNSVSFWQPPKIS